MKKQHIASIGLAVFALLITFYYWHYTKQYASTDNAYLKANTASINANISGQVKQILVKDNQYVKKGQRLFCLDSTALKIALHKAKSELAMTKLAIDSAKYAVIAAKAKVNQAQIQFELDDKNAKRILTLAKKGRTSIAEGDTAKAKRKVSLAALNASQSQYQQALANLGAPGKHNAKLQQAKAQLAQAKLNLSYTKVVAPIAGKIAHLNLQLGDMIQRGQTVFSIIDQTHWWISANFKETQIQHIKPGQKATVTLDMFPDNVLMGTVDSISAGTGSSFALIPTENAAANWVKVTQRIPVKITLKPISLPAVIDSSSYVTIDLNS